MKLLVWRKKRRGRMMLSFLLGCIIDLERRSFYGGVERKDCFNMSKEWINWSSLCFFWMCLKMIVKKRKKLFSTYIP